MFYLNYYPWNNFKNKTVVVSCAYAYRHGINIVTEYNTQSEDRLGYLFWTGEAQP